METKNDNLSAQQSLELITSMIRETQGNASRNSFYFLLWGWVIAVCNFGMYSILNFTEFQRYAPIVWTLCIPAWIVTMIYGSKHDKSEPSTHLGRIMMWLWIGLGITIIPAWLLGSKINWMVNAVILMPVGLATFVSGIIIRFKPLLFGGITFWLAGILCYLVPPGDQFLIGGVAVIFGYLVPGYMLRKINR